MKVPLAQLSPHCFVLQVRKDFTKLGHLGREHGQYHEPSQAVGSAGSVLGTSELLCALAAGLFHGHAVAQLGGSAWAEQQGGAAADRASAWMHSRSTARRGVKAPVPCFIAALQLWSTTAAY